MRLCHIIFTIAYFFSCYSKANKIPLPMSYKGKLCVEAIRKNLIIFGKSDEPHLSSKSRLRMLGEHSHSSYYFDNEVEVKCYSSCATCKEIGDENSNKCETCAEGYYRKENDDENCYNHPPGTNYFFEESGKVYKKCYDSCGTCSELGDKNDTKCLSCNKGYYPVEGEKTKCYDKAPNSSFILDNSEWKRCHEFCESCTSTPKGTNHFCLKCAEGFQPNPYKASNCIPSTPTERWMIKEGTLEYVYLGKNTSSCSKFIFQYSLVPSTGECVKECKAQRSFAGSLPYSFNNICVEKCPLGSEIVDSSYCHVAMDGVEISSENPFGDKGIVYTTHTSRELFIQNIDDCVNLGFNAMRQSNPSLVTVITNDDSKFMLYPTECPDSLCNFTRVKLENCEKNLRKHYKISESDVLYISQMVLNPDKKESSDKVQYNVYSSKKEKLDISLCKSTPITIIKKINKKNSNLKIEQAKEFLSKGIDIYNEKDKFFTDKCLSYSIDKKDLTTTDRKEAYYVNASFCEAGCELIKKDLDEGVVECRCNPKESDNIISILDDIEYVQTFKNLLDTTNIYLFSCYKKLKDKENFLRNYGQWIIVGEILALTILTAVFACCETRKIYSQLSSQVLIVPDNPPKSAFSEIKKVLKKEEEELRPKVKDISEISTQINQNSIETGVKDLKENRRETVIAKVTVEELNAMSFKEATENDKRKLCEMFGNMLVEKYIFLNTILKKSIFYPVSLRMIIFIFTLASFVFVNGLFYTDKYIMRRYEAKEKINFFYLIKNELPKIIYASLINTLISKILSLVISFPLEVRELLSTAKNREAAYNGMKKIIKRMKKKWVLLIVVIFLFSFLYWYFLFVFCSIYKHNQIGIFQSFAVSIILNAVIIFFLSFISSTLRFISLRKKVPCLFKVSTFIGDIL